MSFIKQRYPVTTSIQHCTRGSSQWSMGRKRNKRYLDGKGICKIVTVAYNMIVYIENFTQKVIRANK